MQHQRNQVPHPEPGNYAVSWLNALAVQETAWYPNSLPASQDFCTPRTTTFPTNTIPFAEPQARVPTTSCHYHDQVGTGTGAIYATSHSLLPSCHYNYVPPVVPRQTPLPAIYEVLFPETLTCHAFSPPFEFVNLDTTSTISSSSTEPNFNSVSTSTRNRRQKIELAPDQPLTIDGHPRKRVFVACDRCRMRKLRCDGAHPTCCHCQRVAAQGVVCSYEPAPRRRGQDKAPRIRSPVGQRKPRQPAVPKVRNGPVP